MSAGWLANEKKWGILAKRTLIEKLINEDVSNLHAGKIEKYIFQIQSHYTCVASNLFGHWVAQQ